MLAVLEYADNVTRMSSIVGKIEADASARLVLPVGKDPRQEIARYKAFLKVEQHRLRMLHKGGTGGRDVCRLRAAVLDQLITRILDAIKANLLAAGSPCPKFSLVAIGGYGRGELNPLSDIDIMFLHETSAVTAGKAAPTLGALTDGLLYTLWDSGLKVGHSVRSPDDCVVMANSDMQSKTSLLEARLVYGDKGLYDKMCASLIARSIRGKEAEYIQERLQDQESRRSKHGNSATMQEPNIKERLRRIARLPKPALDGLCEVSDPLLGRSGEKGPVERLRPPPSGCGLRFSSLDPKRASLPEQATDRHSHQAAPSLGFQRAWLSGSLPQQAHRGVHEGSLQPHAEHPFDNPHAGAAPGPPTGRHAPPAAVAGGNAAPQEAQEGGADGGRIHYIQRGDQQRRALVQGAAAPHDPGVPACAAARGSFKPRPFADDPAGAGVGGQLLHEG